ncbi:MAG: helix-turn-helix domain-containing protein [Trebonia sp.]
MAHTTSKDQPDRLLTDQDAAALLKVSKSTVAKARRAGALTTVHVGRAARVRLSEVAQAMQTGLVL